MIQSLNREQKEKLLIALIEKQQLVDANRLNFFKPNPGFQKGFYLTEAKVALATAGNQCTASESRVYDPVLGGYITVGEIKEDFHVVGWDGKKLIKCKAKKPFIKGFGSIFRIELNSGEYFLCTLNHRVLTTQGYVYIRSIFDKPHPSFVDVLPHSNSGSSQSVHVLNDQRWKRTTQDYQYHYSGDHRPYDGRPPFCQGYDQGSPAFSYDAQEYNHPSLLQDDPFQPISLDNHPCLSLPHHSNQGEVAQNEDLSSGPLSHNVYKEQKPYDYQLPFFPQSIVESLTQPQSTDEADRDQYPHYNLPSLTSVKSIKFERDDYYYDFHVPKTNNYIMNGVVHHNSGKTHVGAVRGAKVALGIHPTIKVKTPNTSVIVSAQGFKEGIEKVIVPKILQVVGSRDIIKIKNNSQGTPVKILWRNGSVSHLMSAEQDDKVFEGITLDWFWMDEPMRREIFIALKRGFLTTDGYMWMTCTPLDEAWIYEDLYIKGVEGQDKNIAVFEGTSDENMYISEAAKIEFKKHLTEDEYESRWLGKFKHLTGRVFKHYDPVRHRIPAFDIPEHWPVWCSIDPHTKKPHAVLFVAVSPQNKKYACNEIYLKCDIRTLAEHILDIGSQYNVVQTLVDTSAQEDDWSKKSAREMLQSYGVRTKLAQKKNRKKSGIIMLNQDFKDDTSFVFETCKRLHRELQNQIFTKTKSSSIVSEEPEKKWDDMTDDWRYINAERPMYRNRPRIKTLGFVPYQRSM